MLVAWRYRQRSSLIQSFDPRAYFIFYACVMACTLLFWDVRLLLFFASITLFFLFTSRVRLSEMRRAWLFIGGFMTFYAVMIFLTGRGGEEHYQNEHLVARFAASFRIFGWQPALDVTIERSVYAISQFVRVFSLAGLTILIPYSINPAQYGV